MGNGAPVATLTVRNLNDDIVRVAAAAELLEESRMGTADHPPGQPQT
jgi:hypothetical protein